MKVVGIAAEYNPFHNGHLYHLRASRELTGADCVVAVMSANFTQRGEPAIVDKWARAEMALLAGVDLVIELPVAYAMGSAEYFAYGAVKLLNSLGIVNVLCFGSESGNLEGLSTVAEILANEPDEYKKLLREFLSGGLSYPAARQKALSSYLHDKYGKDSLSPLLRTPNNILGIEYLKAMLRLNSKMVPMTIGRIVNDYNSEELSDDISSATSIRKVLVVNQWRYARKLLESSMPARSLSILEREVELGRGPIYPSNYEATIISSLRKMSTDSIKNLPYMENGLENRIKLAAEKAGSYEELTDLICTRRYTNTRVRRILFSQLIGLNKQDFDYFNKLGGPAYIRILGFSHNGRKVLSTIRGKPTLPIITKAADHKKSDIAGVSEMLALEARATDQYVLGFENPYFRKTGNDFTHNIIKNEHSAVFV